MMLIVLAAGTAALAAPALPAMADKPAHRPSPAKQPKPAAGAPVPAPACADADATPASAGTGRFTAALLCLVNVQRRAQGLGALGADGRLASAAQKYATTLGPNGRLSTRGRDGSSPQSRAATARYAASSSVAEVLGRSIGASATPSRRVSDWMKTATTRRLLLGRAYRSAGVGLATSGETATFVVDLGTA